MGEYSRSLSEYRATDAPSVHKVHSAMVVIVRSADPGQEPGEQVVPGAPEATPPPDSVGVSEPRA
jgi:hypothetical protein